LQEETCHLAYKPPQRIKSSRIQTGFDHRATAQGECSMSEELPGFPQSYAVLTQMTGRPAGLDAGQARWVFALFAACIFLGTVLAWAVV
jgi:hypothetical protein